MVGCKLPVLTSALLSFCVRGLTCYFILAKGNWRQSNFKLTIFFAEHFQVLNPAE